MLSRYSLLVLAAGFEVGTAGGGAGAVFAIHAAIATEHELHGGAAIGRPGNLVQGLQHFQGALGFGLGAFHLELLVAVGNAHLQFALDGAQVFVSRATQVREARVVQQGEDVFENQADNPASA